MTPKIRSPSAVPLLFMEWLLSNQNSHVAVYETRSVMNTNILENWIQGNVQSCVSFFLLPVAMHSIAAKYFFIDYLSI